MHHTSLFLLHSNPISNQIIRKLPRGYLIRIQRINIVIRPVLGLRLHKEQDDEYDSLCGNEQEHNFATPIQLVRIDKIGEYRRQHESCELLANKTESNGLGSRGLRSSLLRNRPAETTNRRGVQHGPGDHEDE